MFARAKTEHLPLIFKLAIIQAMLRSDEKLAWVGFLAAAPQFADEAIGSWADGPDPPDVLCSSVSSKTIGVELTKWVEQDQLKAAVQRRRLEESYRKIVASEREPRPSHIEQVLLYDKSLRIESADAAEFRNQMFDFLAAENDKPLPELNSASPIPNGYWKTVRSWATMQEHVDDFSAYPLLEKYLKCVLISPRSSHNSSLMNVEWIGFEFPGGAYTVQWMIDAAVKNIEKKINKYQNADVRSRHALHRFDLVCYYCDEALLHNTPIHSVGKGFQQVAQEVKRKLATAPKVFDRIFLFHPHEAPNAIRVY